MDQKKNKNVAALYSCEEPSEAQKARFQAFLKEKYGEETEFVWVRDPETTKGFRLVCDNDTYDWTPAGRLQQFRDMLSEINQKQEESQDAHELISLFKSSIDEFSLEAVAEEEGFVRTSGDGIVIVTGLEQAVYGEIVVFESGEKGMVQDLRRGEIGVILFGDDKNITEGSRVRRTKKTAGIPVGPAYVGRVVNALGEAIDGRGSVDSVDFREIETPAPGIIDRQPVDRPMATGLLAIDSMFPIGRGQRELIIGDRQTGKTTIATDTILNQKGKNVVCIYCAIGQKASSVAQLYQTLKKKGAMDYTIIVSALAGDSAPLQYICPYSATALGEYFMHQGKDVLIVYDDLSKHAIAYRAMSLLLERSPGREAYPGDVFYLHSRLLERSAHLSDELGGGSMTALPIVETQDGDVSAYIPTNIISITDGQIFLESDLFFAGQRPAVNIGLSVSRVGGAAQTKAMKKAVGDLRLDLAQYREMEVFTQFSSDLDDTTKRQLSYGQGLMMLLKQPQNHPLSVSEQVVLLVTATAHLLETVPAKKIPELRDALLSIYHEKHEDVMTAMDREGTMSDDVRALILKESQNIIAEFLNKAEGGE